MTTTYIKEGDKHFEVTETKTEIDLDALQEELAYWQDMEEPTDEELIVLGKSISEYYLDRDREIERLTKEIKKWQ